MLRAVGEITRDFGRALGDRVFWLILAAMLLGVSGAERRIRRCGVFGRTYGAVGEVNDLG